VRLDDLVLARACARGHEAAWQQFLTLYREKLYVAASVIAGEESVARELADSGATWTTDDGGLHWRR
jgi:photosystem II stability/assembly factor-like uncharacterized protein